MNAVLITHFLIEKRMDFSLILNEISILVIGAGIGILLNLMMLNNIQRIKENQKELDEIMIACIHNIANLLDRKKSDGFNEVNFDILDQFLEESLEAAYHNAKNTLLTDTKYHLSYLEMRKHQSSVLKNMLSHIKRVPIVIKHSHPIAFFLRKIANDFHERNTVEELLNELESLKNIYREEKLPTTRVEFEYRAILFQVLSDIEIFLNIKRNFILEFSNRFE